MTNHIDIYQLVVVQKTVGCLVIRQFSNVCLGYFLFLNDLHKTEMLIAYV